MAYGHRDVWIRRYVDAVVIGCGGEVVARRPRCCDREDMIFDLLLIEKKINAPHQAAPLMEWDLPPEFATLRRLMEARMLKMGRREYVQVLRLLEASDCVAHSLSAAGMMSTSAIMRVKWWTAT